MKSEFYRQFYPLSEMEKRLRSGDTSVEDIYTENEGTTADFRKLLEEGHLIRYRLNPRFQHVKKHTHNYVEMVYMCSGSTTHIINDTETIKLEEGDLLFLNQHATQEILPAGMEDIAINFIILPEFFDKTLPLLEQETMLEHFLIDALSGVDSAISYLHFRARDILPVQNLIENIIWLLSSENKRTDTVNRLSMGLIFMLLSSYAENIRLDPSDHYEENLVLSALKYIDSHFKDGSLKEVCELVHQKNYALSTLLKKYTGFNFKELLQQRKLQQAEYLLTHTTRTMDDILEVVGYNNSSYFYRIFRELYGMSPRDYRIRKRNIND